MNMSFVSKRYLSIVKCLLTLAPGLVLTPLAVLADSLDEPTNFEIDAQALDTALIEFSEQADIQLVVRGELVADLRSDGLRGEFTPRRALAVLLDDTGLTYTAIGEDSVAVATDQGGDSDSGNAGSAPILMAQNTTSQGQTKEGSPNSESVASEASEIATKSESVDSLRIPEILVLGRQSNNVGITRTENDPQPYVIFDQVQIEKSSAVSLEEFLRTQLPQNTTLNNTNYSAGGNGDARSSINLRGLGSDQTLVLVNGRRLTGSISDPFDGSAFSQPDIAGIPLSSIAKIEVLPATASGIYGGGATGGVVNIILKSNYRGLDLAATYDNSFDSDSSIKRFDATGGFSLEGGKTNVTFSASITDSNVLLNRDREFGAASRALQMENNPDYYMTPGFPPRGATPNIATVAEFDFEYFLETGEIRFTQPDLVLDDGTSLGLNHPGFAGDLLC